MLNRWVIQRCAASCQHSGTTFNQGDPVISRILEKTDGSIKRQDFLANQLPELSSEQTLLSQWSSSYQTKKPKLTSPWSDNSPEKVLQELIDTDNPATEPERYILALLLERQKKIKEVDVRKSHRGQLHVYLHKQTDAVFLIKSATIPSHQLAQLEQKIAKLLQ